MSLQFSVLASGSTGNAFYIRSDKTNLLIDAGLSGKKLDSLFEQIKEDPKDLQGILVTHEHSDHIKGLGIFARKYNLPIYANEKTWDKMSHQLGKLTTDQCFHFEANKVKTFGDIDVESFSVSHDAVDPMFFTFRHNQKKVSLVTDLGYVSEHIKKTVEKSDAYIFESNHDVNMLQMGSYPWRIKQRILGDNGHISNTDCGLALYDCLDNNTERVYLAHLSKDNNMKELAEMTVDQVLKERGVEMKICHTDPEHATPLYTV